MQRHEELKPRRESQSETALELPFFFFGGRGLFQLSLLDGKLHLQQLQHGHGQATITSSESQFWFLFICNEIKKK